MATAGLVVRQHHAYDCSARDKKLIGALVLLGATYLVCCWAMAYGWRSEYRELRLRKVGVVAEATVTASYPRSRKVPAELKYEFSHQGRIFTGAEFVSSTTQQSRPPGSVIRVRYLPDAPNFSRLAERQSRGVRAVYLVGLCLITFFVLGVGIPATWALATGRRIFKPGAFWTTPRKSERIALYHDDAG
jgi:hypothetical protein